VTRKFTLRQNTTERQQLLCQGRGYEPDSSSTPAIGRRRNDFRTSRSAADGPPTSTTSSVPPSTTGVVTVASLASSRTATASTSRSLSQLAQSITVQRLQLRRASQSTTRTPSSTAINPSPEPAGSSDITHVT